MTALRQENAFYGEGHKDPMYKETYLHIRNERVGLSEYMLEPGRYEIASLTEEVLYGPMAMSLGKGRATDVYIDEEIPEPARAGMAGSLIYPAWKGQDMAPALVRIIRCSIPETANLYRADRSVAEPS